MKREEISKIIPEITKEQLDAIMDIHGVNTENHKKSLKLFEEQLNTANETIKGFEGVNVEALNGKIKQYEIDMKEATKKHADDLHAIKYETTLDNALKGSKAKNLTAVKALINRENLKLDGEKLIGYDDIINPIIESNKYLFDVEVENPNKVLELPPSGKVNTPSADPFIAAFENLD